MTRDDVERAIYEAEEWNRKASPPPWEYSSYQSGTRCVSIPSEGCCRTLYEQRMALPPNDNGALNWQPQGHDDQERENLLFVARARNLIVELSEYCKALLDGEQPS